MGLLKIRVVLHCQLEQLLRFVEVSSFASTLPELISSVGIGGIALQFVFKLLRSFGSILGGGHLIRTCQKGSTQSIVNTRPIRFQAKNLPILGHGENLRSLTLIGLGSSLMPPHRGRRDLPQF